MLIYGGSFDPPHLGHLHTALNVQRHFHFDHIFFLPCKQPILKKQTQAKATDRINMLQIMLKEYPEFSISTLEIDRDTPSYMTETLKSLRKEWGNECSITLLMGMDAFVNLNRWHEWEKIPTLCNLLVIQRPQSSKNTTPPTIPALEIQSSQDLDLLTTAYGKFTVFDAGEYPISSTEIREKIRLKKDVSEHLPKEVADYIRRHGLYQ